MTPIKKYANMTEEERKADLNRLFKSYANSLPKPRYGALRRPVTKPRENKNFNMRLFSNMTEEERKASKNRIYQDYLDSLHPLNRKRKANNNKNNKNGSKTGRL